MRAIDPPFRLRVLASIFTLLIPVAVTQWVMASGTPWWRLDFHSLILPAGLAAAPIAVLRIGLLRGARNVLRLGRLASVLWVAGTFLLSLERGSLGQALLGTLLAGFFFVIFTLIGEVFDGPSYDSGIRWFEGLPRFVPGAAVNISVEPGRNLALRLSRLDSRGAYLVAEQASDLDGFGRKPRFLDGVLRYGSEEAEFRARLVTSAPHPSASPRQERMLGIGIEFAGMASDSRKALGDLIEKIRSHGCLDRDGDPALHW